MVLLRSRLVASIAVGTGGGFVLEIGGAARGRSLMLLRSRLIGVDGLVASFWKIACRG
jgi:hypothetical protein